MQKYHRGSSCTYPLRIASTLTTKPQSLVTCGRVPCHSSLSLNNASVSDSCPGGKKRIEKYRGELQRLATINALFSLVATFCAYVCITRTTGGELGVCLEAAVALVSLGQVWLIVLYWRAQGRFAACLQIALSYDFQTRRQSHRTLWRVVPEALAHTLIVIPRQLTAIYTFLHTVNLVLFLAIALRNYHWLRVVYWRAEVSEFRWHFLADVAECKGSLLFIGKTVIRRYGIGVPALLSALVAVVGAMAATLWEDGSLSDRITYASFLILRENPRKSRSEDLPTVFTLLLLTCGLLTLALCVAIARFSLKITAKEAAMMLATREKTARVVLPCPEATQDWWRFSPSMETPRPPGKSPLKTTDKQLIFSENIADLLEKLRQKTVFLREVHWSRVAKLSERRSLAILRRQIDISRRIDRLARFRPRLTVPKRRRRLQTISEVNSESPGKGTAGGFSGNERSPIGGFEEAAKRFMYLQESHSQSRFAVPESL